MIKGIQRKRHRKLVLVFFQVLALPLILVPVLPKVLIHIFPSVSLLIFSLDLILVPPRETLIDPSLSRDMTWSAFIVKAFLRVHEENKKIVTFPADHWTNYWPLLIAQKTKRKAKALKPCLNEWYFFRGLILKARNLQCPVLIWMWTVVMNTAYKKILVGLPQMSLTWLPVPETRSQERCLMRPLIIHHNTTQADQWWKANGNHVQANEAEDHHEDKHETEGLKQTIIQSYAIHHNLSPLRTTQPVQTNLSYPG